MNYSEFEKRIEQMTAAASDATRRRFALDTLRMLLASTQAAIKDELTPRERELLTEVLAGIEQPLTTEPAAKLAELDESMGRDEIRAIEFDHDLTELLCAIDNWLHYQRTGDPDFIARVAINMVNSIDHAIVGRDDDYSNKGDMLGAEEMRQEFERQQRLLTPAKSLHDHSCHEGAPEV
jgi:hypothetical protein